MRVISRLKESVERDLHYGIGITQICLPTITCSRLIRRRGSECHFVRWRGKVGRPYRRRWRGLMILLIILISLSKGQLK